MDLIWIFLIAFLMLVGLIILNRFSLLTGGGLRVTGPVRRATVSITDVKLLSAPGTCDGSFQVSGMVKAVFPPQTTPPTNAIPVRIRASAARTGNTVTINRIVNENLTLTEQDSDQPREVTLIGELNDPCMDGMVAIRLAITGGLVTELQGPPQTASAVTIPQIGFRRPNLAAAQAAALMADRRRFSFSFTLTRCPNAMGQFVLGTDNGRNVTVDTITPLAFDQNSGTTVPVTIVGRKTRADSGSFQVFVTNPAGRRCRLFTVLVPAVQQGEISFDDDDCGDGKIGDDHHQDAPYEEVVFPLKEVK